MPHEGFFIVNGMLGAYYAEVWAPKDSHFCHCITKGHYAFCKVGRDRYGSFAESVAE